MRRIEKVVAAACLSVAMSSVQAEWTGVGNLRNFNVAIESGGNTVRLTHDVMKNPAGCANASFLELQAGVQGFQEMYSVLLAAKTADRPVDLHVSDTACTTSGHPQITQVSYNYTAGGGVIDSLPLATPSLDGLMSASDKAKLDALAAKVDAWTGGPDFESGEFAVGTVSAPHGLPGVPSRVFAVLRCVTAEQGFAVGDELAIGTMADRDSYDQDDYGGFSAGYANASAQLWANAVNVGLTGTGYLRYNGSTMLTASRWRIVLRAWR